VILCARNCSRDSERGQNKRATNSRTSNDISPLPAANALPPTEAAADQYRGI
jgi:hypothetical protein